MTSPDMPTQEQLDFSSPVTGSNEESDVNPNRSDATAEMKRVLDEYRNNHQGGLPQPSEKPMDGDPVARRALNGLIVYGLGGRGERARRGK